MMRAFQTFTPRVRRLVYDSLRQDLGCQDLIGTSRFSTLAFSRICVFDHDTGSELFNRTDLVGYAFGPFNTGSPPPWDARWAAWVATVGIRVTKASFITPPADTTGVASSLFPEVTPSPLKVTIGFTSKNQMGIAIQKAENGGIQIKWFKSSEGDIGSVSFSGVSPVLFGNPLVFRSLDTTEADLVLYYLRPEVPTSIFARFERDDFSVERIINANLPVDIVRLIISEADGRKQKLYAIDSIGRDVTFTSPEYILKFTDDKVDLTVTIDSGDYHLSAVPLTVSGNNRAVLTVSIDSGEYDDVIVEPGAALSGDAGSLTISIDSGEYE